MPKIINVSSICRRMPESKSLLTSCIPSLWRLRCAMCKVGFSISAHGDIFGTHVVN